MRTIILAAAMAVVCDSGAIARPAFDLGDRLYAAPGLECNFYFASGFDSVQPGAYSFEAISSVGRCESARWTWTPSAADAGRREKLVLNAWSDDGLVAAHTVTVVVAARPAEQTRKVTVALLADSLTNARYQDRLMEAMRNAGWSRYVPVGMRTGRSSTPWGTFEQGKAAHDGYGGFTAFSFLDRYAVSVDEIDNLQSAAEKAQLEKFGEKIPSGQEWRRGLLKSPLVRIESGRKVVDPQMWFDRINGGNAPDVILIYLGINGVCAARNENLSARCEETIVNTRRLIRCLRERAPLAVIALGSCIPGCSQDAFGANYGCSISAVQCHKNMFSLNACYRRLVRELRDSGDSRIEYVQVGSAIDPVHGYIEERRPPFVHSSSRTVVQVNAVHPSEEGGRQLGDAWAAWMMCLLSSMSAQASAQDADRAEVFDLVRAEYGKYHRLITGRSPDDKLLHLSIDRKLSSAGKDAYTIHSSGAAVSVVASKASMGSDPMEEKCS